MAISVLFNGITYSIPETGEESWGEELTEYFVAISAGALQKSGGSFTLTADVNFGANFGLLSKYFTSRTSGAATAGQVRLARADVVSWRNQAGLANLDLGVNSSNELVFGGTSIISNAITQLTGDVTALGPGSVAATIAANAVSNAKFRQSAALSVVGNATNALANVADITAGTDNFVLLRSGTALTFALLVNANISASAAIDFSKLAALTSANILVGSAGNVATSVAMSGDVTIGNTGVTAIGANKVTLAMMATMATASFLGRNTASTGNVEVLSATTATAILNAMVGDSGSGGTQGLVPAPAAGDAAGGKFLKADGTWTNPPGVGTVTSVGASGPSGIATWSAAVTGSGTLTQTLSNQSANQVLAGPGSGSAATPAFRALVDADMPSGGFLPPGVIVPYGAAAAPTGWLLCDGSAVSRTTYAALFLIVSTTFGVGNGTTTFNVPSMARRVPMGVGGSGSGTIGNAIGDVGGSETHTLLTAEMPAHTHGTNIFRNAGGNSYANGGNAFNPQSDDSTGGGGSHNNVQPSLVLNYIIKT